MNLRDKYRFTLGKVLVDGYAFLSRNKTTFQDGFMVLFMDHNVYNTMPLHGEPQIGEDLLNTKYFVKKCQLTLTYIKNNSEYKRKEIGIAVFMVGCDEAPLIEFSLFRHFKNEANAKQFAREVNQESYFELSSKKWKTVD